MKKRVLHLTVFHHATDSRIFERECKTLVDAGYEVYLAIPNPPGDELDGVRFIETNNPAYDGNKISRLMNRYISAQRAIRKIDPAVIHIHEPYLIPLLLLHRFGQKKIIYDVHENAPEQALSKEQGFRFIHVLNHVLWEFIESLARMAFQGFAAATPHIEKRFPKERTRLVRNFPLTDAFEVADKNQERKNFIYVGTITRERGIQEMISAMHLLDANHDSKLILVGDFHPPSLREEMMRMPGWTNVQYLGWLGREEVRNQLKNALCGFAIIHPLPNYVEGYPIKVFEYMASGIPVLASDFPQWIEFVEANSCGINLDPTDVACIAEHMEWMLTHTEEANLMGQAGRKAVESKYSWAEEKQQLLSLYDMMLSDRWDR